MVEVEEMKGAKFYKAQEMLAKHLGPNVVVDSLVWEVLGFADEVARERLAQKAKFDEGEGLSW